MTLPVQISLAPLQGFTDFPFRQAIVRHAHGIDMGYSPFIATNELPAISPNRLKDVLPENNGRLPVIPQILSNSPEAFIRMANALWNLGYKTVNWNLGCPFPVVVKKKKGSGLLPYTDRIDNLLRQAIPEIPNAVSIKCRLGLDNPIQILNLIDCLNQYPLHEVIIHPRLGIQKYKGSLDLNTFEKAAERIQAPVVFNGDMINLKGFQQIQKRFPHINAFMIGRGLIRNPFLAEEIRSNALLDHKAERFEAFHQTLYENYDQVLWGPTHIVDRMKGFWSLFSLSFQNGSKIFKKIKKCHRKDHYLALIDAFFKSKPVWLESGESG